MATTGTRSWADAFAARTRAGVGSGLLEILALTGNAELIPFAGGFPDPQTFPADAAARFLAELTDDGEAFQYAPTRGLPGPLATLAARIESLQGRRPEDDELMLTSGGIEALELLGKSFLDPGDLVVVEGPTYLGGIMAFRSFEAEVIAVALDDDGLDTDELDRALTGRRAKLLYAIPDHQNPAGVSLSSERRHALVELARKHGFLIVEDVAYRELGFDASALPSLWSLGPDVTVQVGTTSKTFFPGVRLGWALGPPEIVAQLVVAKQNTDQCTAALAQKLFERYARTGEMDAQLARSRDLYRRRCELILAALDSHMPDSVRWTRPEGGFFTWLTAPGDSVDLARRAADAGVAIVPGAPFFPDGRGAANVRLSFSRVADDQIDEGIRRLAKLIDD